MATAKPKLKPYPFREGGAKDNLPIRMVRMVAPYCPADPRPELVLPNGDSVPNPHYTGEPNCQFEYRLNNMGRWQVEKCIELGHDPYYTTTRRRVLEEVVGDDGFVTESKVRIKVSKVLNVMPVAVGVRYTDGKEYDLAVARGYKHLEEFGYASPCEYRQCSQPQRLKTRFGNYCGERHARLIGAMVRGIMLPIAADEAAREKTDAEREDLLERVNIGAVEL